MPKKLEKEIEGYLVKQCKKMGLLTYKFSSPSNRGVPDRIVIGGGKVCFFELKRPGEVLRPLQKHIKQKFEQQGTTVYVADSYELVDLFLERYFIR